MVTFASGFFPMRSSAATAISDGVASDVASVFFLNSLPFRAEWEVIRIIQHYLVLPILRSYYGCS
jgi:hypothetical protein